MVVVVVCVCVCGGGGGGVGVLSVPPLDPPLVSQC